MKKHIHFFFIFLYLIFTIENANAVSTNFSFTQFCGFRKGVINEYVFEKNSSGDLKKLSQLEWELNPAFYMGLATDFLINFGKNNNHQIGIEPFFAWFRSSQSGKMYDSDWLELDDVKNIYSISENSIDTGLFTGINLFWKHSPFKLFSFLLEASFQYDYIHFEAKNGYGWYGNMSSTGTNVSYDSPYAKFLPVGQLYGIAYKKKLTSTWFSAQVFFLPTKYTTFSLGAGITPFVYFSSIDKHYNSGGGKFYKDVAAGLFCQGKAFCSIDVHNPSKTAIFSFGICKSFSSVLIGLSYMGTSYDGPFYLSSTSKCGGDINYWDFTFSLTVKTF